MLLVVSRIAVYITKRDTRAINTDDMISREIRYPISPFLGAVCSNTFVPVALFLCFSRSRIFSSQKSKRSSNYVIFNTGFWLEDKIDCKRYLQNRSNRKTISRLHWKKRTTSQIIVIFSIYHISRYSNEKKSSSNVHAQVILQK